GMCTKQLGQGANSRSAGFACQRKQSLHSRCKHTAQVVQFISCTFLSQVLQERAMPAMKELQLCNRRPNIAGAARSYRVIISLT
ncbi:MAG: hypothetical protein WAW41_06240, partial [Methylobacter sp.]